MNNANASAFPLVETEHNKGVHAPDWFSVHSVAGAGLTKREIFAMAAMQGILAAGFLMPNDEAEVSKQATRNADALLLELAKVQS